eukprot:gene18275-23952_t
MEASRILGKDGKEPLKWDWYLINDMLEYSFQNSDRLSEALKTKWVRRLSGFFRCSNEDKAYYASMEWNSNNFHYLECACNLYHILVEDDIGMSFLTSDRRASNPANSLPNSAKTNIFTNTSSNTTSTGILNHHRRRNDAVGVQSLNNNNNIVNRLSNGYVYLIEIQYYFRIQTQQSLFVPMPRHFFATVRKDNNNDSLKSSAFWSLGHIGSTDYV